MIYLTLSVWFLPSVNAIFVLKSHMKWYRFTVIDLFFLYFGYQLSTIMEKIIDFNYYTLVFEMDLKWALLEHIFGAFITSLK